MPRATDPIPLGAGAAILPGFALDRADLLLGEIANIAAAAPFRHWQTPGGAKMSVAMTSCGPLGWISDRRGYRYETADPLAGAPWPPMPPVFRALAVEAAHRAGHKRFEPDACLVNRYEPETRLSLHQDRDELDLDAPIVSVSLGLPAIFLFGGLRRTDLVARHRLAHGDVVVWGGASRLAFHGIAPVKQGAHPATGAVRFNLTFRRVSRLP